jgi:uncharacterized Zn-finger protein
MCIAALVLSKHYSIQGTDPSIWERICTFRNGSRHAETDPLLNVRILSKMSESVTKCLCISCFRGVVVKDESS